MMMKRFLERPRGTRDFALAEMQHRATIERALQKEFGQWGYQPIETPLLEYAATFAKGLHEGEEERMYRLFDAAGQTLALRPEMTTPVARLAATVLSEEPLPLRLCYSAKTYREQGPLAHEAAEVTQVGVELLGDDSADADAEMIAMMVGGLARLGLSEFRIALGHVGYVSAMLDQVGRNARELLVGALMDRDLVTYERTVRGISSDSESDLSSALLELPHIRGGREALQRARVLAQSGDNAARLACDDMFDVWQALCEHGVGRFVQFDLGLYPNHDYYTGVVMEGYVDRLGQRICYGGRYDHLLAKFGRPLPATGCVLHLERLQDAVEVSAPARDLIALSYEPACRADALGFARDLRGRGYQVATTLYPLDEASAKRRDGVAEASADSGGQTRPSMSPVAPTGARGVARSAVIWDRSGPTLQGDALLTEMFAQFQERRPLPC